MSSSINLNHPVRAITVDATGMPGSRTFYLQFAGASGQIQSLLIEKTQAMLLADEIEAFLGTLPWLDSEQAPGAPGHVPALCQPETVMFRAGHFELQYHEGADLIGLEVSELRGLNQGTPAALLIWATRQQMHALAEQARHVARSGLASAT